MEKAKQANSPEELLALAKVNDYPLDEESAKAYFEKIHKSGELSDDELDNVAVIESLRKTKKVIGV